MVRFLLALALMGLPAASWAQTAQSGALSGSQSGAIAGAGSQSASGAAIYQTWNSPPGVAFSGSYTIRNTPQVYAPAVTGTNPCMAGASAGTALAGFGLTLGGSWSDPNCERRNLAALTHNMGNPALAQEVLCGSRDFREARLRMASAGQGAPCLADSGAVAPPTVSQPITQAAVQPTRPVIPVSAGDIRPAWCYAVTGPEERRRFAAQCGG